MSLSRSLPFLLNGRDLVLKRFILNVEIYFVRSHNR